MKILPLTAILLALGAAPAAAATPAALPSGVVKTTQARFGGGFGGRGFGRSTYRSRPRYAPTSRYRRSPYFRSRPHFGRRLFRGFLQALGIAYLAHMLFGLGAGGGSPFGLLLLLGIVFWMISRMRRRRVAYSRW
jgi:hypothetical protein